jgi:Mce-associated membrane protein
MDREVTTPEVTIEEASASERGAEQTSSEVTTPEVTIEEASASERGAEQTSSESTATEEISTEVTGGDAATTEVTTPAATTEEASASEGGTEQTGTGEAGDEDVELAVEVGASRLGRGWLAVIAAALVLAAGGVGWGGYQALRYHHQNQSTARNNAAALEAAKTCIAATQAPDTSAIMASEQKIVDCGTDEYRTQALLYTSMLVQAYQAANVHIQVADERAAVLRNNSDGSVDILVALRVKVTNDQAQDQETGYRLRVKMASVDGQYKIAKLEQVTK